MKRIWIGLILVGAGVGVADTVTLKSGAVISGEIVAEDAYEVRVVVSRTVSGEIQTQKIIAQALVQGLERGNPDVAVEAEPVVPGDAAAEATPLPDASPLAERLARADRLTGAGKYDDAARDYRAVADEVACRLKAHPESGNAAVQAGRLELLGLGEDADAHLLIALQGKLDRKGEALEIAEANAKKLERQISLARDEWDDLRRDDAEDGVSPRRLGNAAPEVNTTMRIRELEERIAADGARLQAHRTWAANERLAIVALESEIDLARVGAKESKEAHEGAERKGRGGR